MNVCGFLNMRRSFRAGFELNDNNLTNYNEFERRTVVEREEFE